MERPLTVAEAAEFLSIHNNQIRVYINKGLLKAHRIGNGTNKKKSTRPWRIWKEDLIAFINRDSNIKENKK